MYQIARFVILIVIVILVIYVISISIYYQFQVIGSAGGPDKCSHLLSKYGFDKAIDYKNCADKEALISQLKAATGGQGIDM
jgi:NADPH-dependent curcumin reductase CurA